jgi:hypothetical protein
MLPSRPARRLRMPELTSLQLLRGLLRRATRASAWPLRGWIRGSGRCLGRFVSLLAIVARMDLTARWRIVPITSTEEPSEAEVGVILAACRWVDAAVRPIDASHHAEDSGHAREQEGTDFPAIRWREAADARLLGALRTHWVDRHGLHLEPSEYIFRRTTLDPLQIKVLGRAAECREALLLEEFEPVAHLEEAIYPGAAFADNWYHWVAEVLPRIWLTGLLPEEFSSTPILVPERALRSKHHLTSLRFVVDLNRIVPLSDWSVTAVDRLIWVDGMFDMSHLAGAGGPVPSRFHLEGMRRYRETLVRKSARSALDRKVPERVFLDRGGHARGYNRDEILKVAAKHGFTPIRPETMSFEEQILVFQRARIIIGPSGGAWSGLLFGGPEQIGLYWMPDSLAGSGMWASLAAIGGSTVFELTHSEVDASTGSYRLDPDALDTALTGLTG